jgi:hypothetical protein
MCDFLLVKVMETKAHRCALFSASGKRVDVKKHTLSHELGKCFAPITNDLRMRFDGRDVLILCLTTD